MNVKLIMFDFGGTLDTNGIHWSELFWNFYQKNNIQFDYELFRTGYLNAQKFIDNNKLLEEKTLKMTIYTKILTQEQMIYDKTNIHYLSSKQIYDISQDIYNFVVDNVNQSIITLQKLKPIKKLAIVSNYHGNLDIVCNELGLAPYFDYLIDSTLVDLWKPDPKIFEYCINLSGEKANESVIIGDSYSRDIVPAKSLGCYTIWLKKQSWEKPDNTKDADFIINSLNDLNKIF